MEANSIQQPIQTRSEKPTGPVAAALLATGIGALALGILTVLAEASEGIHSGLEFSAKVGPLSGKTIIAVIVFVGSWLVLNGVLKKKEVDLKKVTVVTIVLLVAALILTFPPFFQLFTTPAK